MLLQRFFGRCHRNRPVTAPTLRSRRSWWSISGTLDHQRCSSKPQQHFFELRCQNHSKTPLKRQSHRTYKPSPQSLHKRPNLWIFQPLFVWLQCWCPPTVVQRSLFRISLCRCIGWGNTDTNGDQQNNRQRIHFSSAREIELCFVCWLLPTGNVSRKDPSLHVFLHVDRYFFQFNLLYFNIHYVTMVKGYVCGFNVRTICPKTKEHRAKEKRDLVAITSKAYHTFLDNLILLLENRPIAWLSYVMPDIYIKFQCNLKEVKRLHVVLLKFCSTCS